MQRAGLFILNLKLSNVTESSIGDYLHQIHRAVACCGVISCHGLWAEGVPVLGTTYRGKTTGE